MEELECFIDIDTKNSFYYYYINNFILNDVQNVLNDNIRTIINNSVNDLLNNTMHCQHKLMKVIDAFYSLHW